MDKRDRMRINCIKAGAYLASDGTLHVEGDASIWEAERAARELLGAECVTLIGRGKHTGYWQFTHCGPGTLHDCEYFAKEAN